MPEPECIKVRTAPEFWEQLCVYNYRGDRLHVRLGKPDAEGFYVPIVCVDTTDNLLRKALLIGTPAAPVQ